MKKFRRIMAVMLTVIMALAMSSAVWADVTPPSDQVKGTVQVLNVEKDAEVLYYQIVDGVYNTSGLTGYQVVSGYTIANIEQPTSEEITAAAQIAIHKDATGTMVWDEEKGAFTANVEAGSYLVLVKGTGDTLYNPMIVSVDYTNANDARSIDAGSVDAKTQFAYGNVTYAKSTTPSVDKTIVKEDGSEVEGDTVNAKGGDASANGDTITFKIETTIPSYTTSTTTTTAEEGGQTTTTNTTVYNPCIFKISDTLDDTFNNIENLKIKNGSGTTATELAETDYTISGGNGSKTFTVTLKEDYIKANGNGKIVITYNTTLSNANNAQNYDENKNTAKIEYSNDPTNGAKTRTITDTTYHYTFGIDALANAEESEYGEEHDRTETHELNKVTDEDGNTNYVETNSVTYTDKTTKTQKSEKALAGAEFTLYSDDACATALSTATSDANGHISFTGLDAGTYYMKETAAPAGYTLNDTVYKIVIAATLNDDGILTKYSVTTSKKDGNAWTEVGSATYTCAEPAVNKETGEITYSEISTTITPVSIVDTPNPELPSTGGMGVYLFTIIGVAVMAVMAYLFFKGDKAQA